MGICGVEPVGIDVVLDAGAIALWLRPALPPTMILMGPAHRVARHVLQECELVRPAARQEPPWLARTDCAVNPDVIANALAAGIRAPGMAR